MKKIIFKDGTSRSTKRNSIMAYTTKGVRVNSGTWLVVALLLLSLPPLLSGAFRLAELAGVSDIMPPRERFHAAPFPVVLHIVSATIYAILGAFQFAPAFRRKFPGWHRAVGRLLVGCGGLVGLSAVWMTLFYRGANGSSTLLYGLRLFFGVAMVLSILFGFVAIRRGDVRQHRNWMIRAYAIGLGAGTQMLTLMAGEWVAGPPDELGNALLMGAGWGINFAIAEWIIRSNGRALNKGRRIMSAQPDVLSDLPDQFEQSSPN